MPDKIIVLASPNRTTVFRGEYVKIDMNKAPSGDALSLAQLPGETSLVIGDLDGSEIRWVGPTSLIYRAPKNKSSDSFKVRQGDGVHNHFIKVDFGASQSTPAEQANLKVLFEAALPTIVTSGKGVGSLAGPDPRIEGARTRAQALVDYLK